jgi:hypothetical protein
MYQEVDIMIDFSEVGTIVLHDIEGTKCVQLFPHEGKTIQDMLEVLDEGLGKMNHDSSSVIQRGILLDREEYKIKRSTPIPCVFLFD